MYKKFCASISNGCFKDHHIYSCLEIIFIQVCFVQFSIYHEFKIRLRYFFHWDDFYIYLRDFYFHYSCMYMMSTCISFYSKFDFHNFLWKSKFRTLSNYFILIYYISPPSIFVLFLLYWITKYFCFIYQKILYWFALVLSILECLRTKYGNFSICFYCIKMFFVKAEPRIPESCYFL